LSSVITGDKGYIYGYDPETKQQFSQWRSPNSPRACSYFPLTSRGLFTKNLAWQAKQSIVHTTVTFYGNCTKICKDFAPNFGDKRTGCCITTMHHLTLPFLPGNFFNKNNMTVVPHPPYFSFFPLLKVRLRGSHFHTFEVIEAGSQEVMNILTDHEFEDAFKMWQKCWELCIHAEGDYFEGDGGQ
jgi:hypothetical protein